MRQSDLFIQPKRPRNAGRLIGPKAPLKPQRIRAIRQKAQVARRVRDLAMFNCALAARLRSCDPVRLRVSGVAAGGALPPGPSSGGSSQARPSSRRCSVTSPYTSNTAWAGASALADTGT